MVVGKQRLYADHGGCMVVLDLATGAEIERLGEARAGKSASRLAADAFFRKPA